REYEREQCVHNLIAEQAERTPDSVALVSGEAQLTYAELERRVSSLGAYLKKLGVGHEATVGIYLERSAEMVIGLLGTWKAGGAYLGLDRRYPEERLKYMVRDSGARVVVTQSGMGELLG